MDRFISNYHLLLVFAGLALFWAYGCSAMKPWCSLIDTALVDWSTSSIPAETHKDCHQACLRTPGCESANYWSQKKQCELNSISHSSVSGRYLVQQPGSLYTYTKQSNKCHFKTTDSQGLVWHRVYTGVAGSGNKLHDMWTREDWDASLEISGSCRNNGLHRAWRRGKLNIERVKLSLWVGTESKVELMFNGAGSDIRSWFTQANLISASPWSDLRTASTDQNGYFFSIDGHVPTDRRFYINHILLTCNVDQGWLVVVDSKSGPCQWEEATPEHPYSIILYSTTNGSVHFENMNKVASSAVGRADYLTIDVQTV